jgi:hypothetical protein
MTMIQTHSAAGRHTLTIIPSDGVFWRAAEVFFSQVYGSYEPFTRLSNRTRLERGSWGASMSKRCQTSSRTQRE